MLECRTSSRFELGFVLGGLLGLELGLLESSTGLVTMRASRASTLLGKYPTYFVASFAVVANPHENHPEDTK